VCDWRVINGALKCAATKAKSSGKKKARAGGWCRPRARGNRPSLLQAGPRLPVPA